MQMLGINVGRTGSAMLGEAAIAMKGISAAGKTIRGGGSGAADSGGYPTSGSETILQGGLALADNFIKTQFAILQAKVTV